MSKIQLICRAIAVVSFTVICLGVVVLAASFGV